MTDQWQTGDKSCVTEFYCGSAHLGGKPWLGNSEDNPPSSLPEVTVGVYDPHSKALDPGLLGGDTRVTAKHAQGELVDPRLQHGAELPLEVGGLVRLDLLDAHLALHVGVQQAVGIRRVVVIVRLDQGEERPGHLAPLLWPRGRGCGRGRPLGAASPPREAEAAPAAVPGGLLFVRRALAGAFLVICAPGEAHFTR